MSLELSIWSALVANSVMYIWFERSVLSKNASERPKFFRSEGGLAFALIGPLAIFFLLVGVAFVYTANGWLITALVFLVCVSFTIEPDTDD